MDYYYDHELEDNGDYDYDSLTLLDESFSDVYQGCIKSSTKQVQQYIIILLGCGFLQRISWEIVKCILGNKYLYLYHIISILCGVINLWFYAGIHGSIYVCVHVLNLCLILKVAVKMEFKYTGFLLCMYTIVCQLFFEYLLKMEQYETIRGPQMMVSMKLISVAFEIQDDKNKFQLLCYLGYLLSPTSLILGPWISLKNYGPVFNNKFRILHHSLIIFFYIFLAVLFLNLSNCIIPWLKQLLGAGLLLQTYLDAFSVRCSHYFVCYLSQATMSASSNTLPSSLFLSLSPPQSIVNPLAIEFPRSISDVVRNWNIPMHLWLKQNIFNRLRATRYPYFVAIFLTYLVSCLVHGFNYKVHLVLVSLGFFGYVENILRRCLAQVFDACVESTACKQSCKYTNCTRRVSGKSCTTALLLVRLINFIFSILVILQLAYLGVMLNVSPTAENESIGSIVMAWYNMNYFGHILALIMFLFYKCI